MSPRWLANCSGQVSNPEPLECSQIAYTLHHHVIQSYVFLKNNKTFTNSNMNKQSTYCVDIQHINVEFICCDVQTFKHLHVTQQTRRGWLVCCNSTTLSDQVDYISCPENYTVVKRFISVRKFLIIHSGKCSVWKLTVRGTLFPTVFIFSSSAYNVLKC